MASYAVLAKKRGGHAAVVTRIATYVQEFDVISGTSSQLEQRRKTLIESRKKHDEVINQMLEHQDSEEATIYQFADDFANQVEATFDNIETIIRMLNDKEEKLILINDRGLAQKQLDLARDEIKSYQVIVADKYYANAGVIEINMHLREIEKIHDNYEREHNIAVEKAADDEDIENLMAERRSFMLELFKVQSFLVSEVDKQQIASPRIAHGSNSSSTRAKLPTIELPKFDGNPDEFIAFRDKFISLIHSNNDIDKVLKFHYLKAYITDKNNPIAHLPETEDGYDTAWAAVQQRYDDKRAQIDCHFQALLKTKRMTIENYDELETIRTSFSLHVSALKRIAGNDELLSALIAHILTSKLDAHTKDLAETHRACEIPSYDDLNQFLEKRSRVLKTLPKKTAVKQSPSDVFKSNESNAKVPWRQTKSLVSTQGKTLKCALCSQAHVVWSCKDFILLTTSQRNAKVRELRLCFNCLGEHQMKDCKSKSTCKTCGKFHHSLLHPDSTSVDAAHTANPTKKVSTSTMPYESAKAHTLQLDPFVPSFQASNTLSATTGQLSSITLLSTAIVTIKSRSGEIFQARALLDSGSDVNFITKSAAEALQLHQDTTRVEAQGLGQRTTIIDRKLVATIGSRMDKCQIEMEFLITPHITGITPMISHEFTMFSIPKGIVLADPTFNVPGRIDLLIGNKFFWQLVRNGQIELASGATLKETSLGWILAGSVSPRKNNQTTKVQCHVSTLGDLQNTMQRFYNLEDYRNDKGFLTDEERFCEQSFEQTHRRDATGRFIVQIPLKSNSNQLVNNRGQAFHQLIANEKRLIKKPELHKKYNDFLQEYKDLGHMTEIDPVLDNGSVVYYMPHHAVENPSSTTTSVRVVFNASSKTRSGLSFNDVQGVGPQIQTDAFKLTLKLRRHPIVIKADIAKMYRQVNVDEHQRPLQRILWRDDSDGIIKTFELNTLTYGTAAASFLSTRCLKQLAIENREKHPEAAEEIENGFFVDDLISGASTAEKAILLFKTIDMIVSSAQMKLRKISSNNEKFMHAFPQEDREIGAGNDGSIKALGIKWNTKSDEIEFDVKPIDVSKISKRSILSEIAKIYDPVGLLGPVVFSLKTLMKTVWLLNVTWDEEVPEIIANEWKQIAQAIMKLNEVRISRHILITQHVEAQLHGFSDASEKGFGAAVYIISQDSAGNRNSHLVCAKSRIAPKEKRSIARLELCGAVVLAKLMQTLTNTLNIDFSRKISWSDSAIVIHWLRKQPAQLQPFVANRVSEIQEMSRDTQWRHIPGVLNPADLISRGLAPHEIVHNNLWWHGPSFLTCDEECWPESIVQLDPEEPEFKAEFKKVQSLVAQQKPANQFIVFINNASSMVKLKRQLAPVIRFIHNLRHPSSKRDGPLTISDHRDAEHALARVMQLEHFPDEFKKLSRNQRIDRASRLNNLSPFWDPELKLIRVGGRLNLSEQSDEQKHPILLPKCHFATLIVRDLHRFNMHAGQLATHGFIKQRYWPLRATEIIRKEIRSCVTCFRARPKLIKQFMGQLPPARVNPAPIFFNTGIDYAGPFGIKSSALRNSKIIKAYVAIFICLSSKAVHIEIVSDLTTDAFIAALDRFTSRRGLSGHIYTDNAKNFVGANNKLRDLYKFLNSNHTQRAITQHLASYEITWHHIPPRAPTHGGLWEAAVKSLKTHLVKTTSNASLTFEEFNTISVKAEAILNSRSLTRISEDPNDEKALTAGHLLIGRPLNSLPQHDLTGVPPTRLQRWDRVQQIQQHFWHRFRRDYLHQLQTRAKNFKDVIDVKIGQLVLVEGENLPTMQWPIGRIINISPGKDGCTRVATIRTSTNQLTRSVDKLALIPEPNED